MRHSGCCSGRFPGYCLGCPACPTRLENRVMRLSRVQSPSAPFSRKSGCEGQKMAICEPLRSGVIARHAFGGIPPGQNFWKEASYSIPLTYRCFLSTTIPSKKTFAAGGRGRRDGTKPLVGGQLDELCDVFFRSITAGRICDQAFCCYGASRARSLREKALPFGLPGAHNSSS